MGKTRPRYAFGTDANSPTRPEPDYRQPSCAWRACRHPRWEHTPVCIAHALIINGRIIESNSTALQGCDLPPPMMFQSFVYYLMLSPVTVKIGTTQWLPDRIRQLRTELQYVVALELGDRLVERERHLQFAAERRNKQREDFHLSDRLTQHINELQPQREELMRLAIEHKPLTA